METLNSNDPAFLETCHRWLLFHYHCNGCAQSEESCTYGKVCSYGKSTFTHVRTCTRSECTFPRCEFIKYILRHHQMCKDDGCHVCSPVCRYRARNKGPEGQPCSPPTTEVLCPSSSAASLSQASSQQLQNGTPPAGGKRNSALAELDGPAPPPIGQWGDQQQSEEQEQQQQRAGMLFEARHREHKRQMSGTLGRNSWPVDASEAAAKSGGSSLTSAPSASMDAVVELQALQLEQAKPSPYQQQQQQTPTSSSNTSAQAQPTNIELAVQDVSKPVVSGGAPAVSSSPGLPSGRAVHQPQATATAQLPGFQFTSAAHQPQQAGLAYGLPGLTVLASPTPPGPQQQQQQLHPPSQAIAVMPGVTPHNTAPQPHLTAGLQLQQPMSALGAQPMMGALQFFPPGAFHSGVHQMTLSHLQQAFSIPAPGASGTVGLTVPGVAAVPAGGPSMMQLQYGGFVHSPQQQPLQLVNPGTGVSYTLVHHPDFGSVLQQVQHHPQQQQQQFPHHPQIPHRPQVQQESGMVMAPESLGQAGPGTLIGSQCFPGVSGLPLGCGPAALESGSRGATSSHWAAVQLPGSGSGSQDKPSAVHPGQLSVAPPFPSATGMASGVPTMFLAPKLAGAT